jgi:SAM-dependent methyltransferase
MKQKLLKFLNGIAYPQSLFSGAILRFVDKEADGVMVDAPCGRGATSWCLAKKSKLKIYGYDIDENSIESAKKNFFRDNLSFKQADIFTAIALHTNAKYFCIINSLFLLPEPERILREVKNALSEDGTFFVIVPNTEGPNFLWFEANHKGVNKLILSENELEPYFSSNGWLTERKMPLAYAQSIGRSNLIASSPLSPFILRVLNLFQSLSGKPNYFLLCLKKKK